MAKILFIRERADQHCETSLRLQNDGHDVRVFSGANVAPIKSSMMDFAVIDVNLDARALKLVKLIHVIKPRTVIIVLIRLENLVEKRVDALLRGADFCEAKSLPSAILLAYFQSMIRRMAHLVWRLDLAESKLHAPDGHVELLSIRELIVLKVLADSAGHLAHRTSMVNAVRGTSFKFEERSLDQLVSRLRSRWFAHTADKLPIKTEHGTGYRFCEELRILVAAK